MNPLDKELEASQEVVALQDFFLRYKPGSVDLYCFHEGDDDLLYYKSIIRRISGLEIHCYVCGGKQSVINVFTSIKAKPEYVTAKAGFFIDRDFDLPINNPDIYETPCYSIENLYVDSSVLEEVLKDVFKIKSQNDLQTVLNLYNVLQNEFHLRLLTLNAFLKSYAVYKNSNTALPRLNTDDVLRKYIKEHVIDVNLNSITIQSLTFLELLALFKLNGIINQTIFNQEMYQLQQTDMSCSFRGKFEILFMSSFLKRFCGKVGNKKKVFLLKRYHSSIDFKVGNMLLLLNTFAIEPKSLRAYIKKIAA